jgi:hypothetical protein
MRIVDVARNEFGAVFRNESRNAMLVRQEALRAARLRTESMERVAQFGGRHILNDASAFVIEDQALLALVSTARWTDSGGLVADTSIARPASPGSDPRWNGKVAHGSTGAPNRGRKRRSLGGCRRYIRGPPEVSCLDASSGRSEKIPRVHDHETRPAAPSSKGA